jgi:hypothetical protein
MIFLFLEAKMMERIILLSIGKEIFTLGSTKKEEIFPEIISFVETFINYKFLFVFEK